MPLVTILCLLAAAVAFFSHMVGWEEVSLALGILGSGYVLSLAISLLWPKLKRSGQGAMRAGLDPSLIAAEIRTPAADPAVTGLRFGASPDLLEPVLLHKLRLIEWRTNRMPPLPA